MSPSAVYYGSSIPLYIHVSLYDLSISSSFLIIILVLTLFADNSNPEPLQVEKVATNQRGGFFSCAQVPHWIYRHAWRRLARRGLTRRDIRKRKLSAHLHSDLGSDLGSEPAEYYQFTSRLWDFSHSSTIYRKCPYVVHCPPFTYADSLDQYYSMARSNPAFYQYKIMVITPSPITNFQGHGLYA
ncbi:hypothetical protein MSAN_00864000 [Mycena sanguinolenta]|uniref:Uncharacterized protein n=1 Tax=Mycena sanguinolenta TaxID=230812 RepID=A0A8H6YVR1_9AGAR|nr:hypothetical protein MSAN_00864000 [Mycena sanguinolenta]